MGKRLTKEQQNAEREAIVLARGLGNKHEFDREEYKDAMANFTRQKVVQYLERDGVQFEVVNADLIDYRTGSHRPYQTILKNLAQRKDAPRYFQLRRNNGEVMMSFKTGKVHTHELQRVVGAIPEEELDPQTIRIKELLNKYEKKDNDTLFWISLLDESGKGPRQLLEEHLLENSRGRYKIEVMEDGAYRWRESPENILYDKGLSLCISVEPQTFGYLPEANTNLRKDEKCSRFVFADHISYFSDSQPDLEKRTCGAHFYLKQGEHLADPVRARDILRMVAGYDALGFEFEKKRAD